MKQKKSRYTKNDSIEQTVEKMRVRHEITHQVTELIDHLEQKKTLKDFKVISLPAINWYFENHLLNVLRMSQKDINISFEGIEGDKESAGDSLYNMPQNATLTYADWNEYFVKEHIVNKKGAGELTSEPIQMPKKYDLMWADFCGEATVTNLLREVDKINNNIDDGLYYITIDGSSRQANTKEYARRFKHYSKASDLKDVIEETLKKMIATRIKGKNVKLVYSVIYGGGQYGRTTMYTFGFSVGIPKDIITFMSGNRREEKNALRKDRYQLAMRLKREEWSIGRVASGFKSEKPIAKNDSRAKAAASRWESKWKPLTQERKEKIAARYGKSVHSFASMVSWYHGKLKNKRLSRAA
jgi:hypothetical protein